MSEIKLTLPFQSTPAVIRGLPGPWRSLAGRQGKILDREPRPDAMSGIQRGGMRALARRVPGPVVPGWEVCRAGLRRGAAGVWRREVVSPSGHSGAHMALNRHFRRHFVLVCAGTSAISRGGLSLSENDPG